MQWSPRAIKECQFQLIFKIPSAFSIKPKRTGLSVNYLRLTWRVQLDWMDWKKNKMDKLPAHLSLPSNNKPSPH